MTTIIANAYCEDCGWATDEQKYLRGAVNIHIRETGHEEILIRDEALS